MSFAYTRRELAEAMLACSPPDPVLAFLSLYFRLNDALQIKETFKARFPNEERFLY
jgi:hypothetical protein